MRKTITFTTEQISRLMSEGVVYDVDNVKENPRMRAVAAQNNGSINLGSFSNGSDNEEPVNITTDVDKAGETAA